MKKSQVAKHNMTDKLDIFFTSKQSVFDPANSTYVTAVAAFRTTKTKWDNLVPLLEILSRGTTASLKVAKHHMADYSASLAKTVRGTALTLTPDPDLVVAGDMNHSAPQI